MQRIGEERWLFCAVHNISNSLPTGSSWVSGVFSLSCQYIPGLCMHAEKFASYLLCLHQGNPELLSWLYSQSIPNLPQHPRVDYHQHWNLSFPPQLEQLRCRLHLQQGKSAVIAVRISEIMRCICTCTLSRAEGALCRAFLGVFCSL